jgi:hypothetical protein
MQLSSLANCLGAGSPKRAATRTMILVLQPRAKSGLTPTNQHAACKFDDGAWQNFTAEKSSALHRALSKSTEAQGGRDMQEGHTWVYLSINIRALGTLVSPRCTTELPTQLPTLLWHRRKISFIALPTKGAACMHAFMTATFDTCRIRIRQSMHDTYLSHLQQAHTTTIGPKRQRSDNECIIQHNSTDWLQGQGVGAAHTQYLFLLQQKRVRNALQACVRTCTRLRPWPVSHSRYRFLRERRSCSARHQSLNMLVAISDHNSRDCNT